MIPMLYKFGTAKEVETLKDKIPYALYQVALNIVNVLDDNYGTDRDVDEEDGGFVVILQNIQDIEEATTEGIQLDEDMYEHVNLVKCENGDYINVLYLANNEFGINVFLPKDIAPTELLDGLDGEGA